MTTPHDAARFSIMERSLAACVLVAALGCSGTHTPTPPPPPDPAGVLDDTTCPGDAQTIAQIDDPGITIGSLRFGSVRIGAVAVAEDGSVYFVQTHPGGANEVIEIYAVVPGGTAQRIATAPGYSAADAQIWIEGDTLSYLALGALYTVPRAGGNLTLVANTPAKGAGLFSTWLHDATYAYAVATAQSPSDSFHGEVWRLPRTGGVGERIYTSTDPKETYLYKSSIALDETSIYYTSDAGVLRMPKEGGAPTLLYASRYPSYDDKLVLSGSILHVSNFDGVVRADLATLPPAQPPTVLPIGKSSIFDMVGDALGVTVLLDMWGSGNERQDLVRLGRGEAHSVALACFDRASGYPDITVRALDAHALYAVVADDILVAPRHERIVRVPR